MEELVIRIESISNFNDRIVRSVEAGKATPASYSFQSIADMGRALTTERIAIVRLLMRGEPMTSEQIANQAELSRSDVTANLKALCDLGLVLECDQDAYRVEFSRIRLAGTITAT